MRFDDPFEIIAHLMVGSEGTLAFLAGVTMRTEREYEHKASAMVYFSDIGEASRAVVEMRKLQDSAGERIVHSAEMLDRKSLASVGDTTGEGLTAVLTETKAHTPEELAANVARIGELLGRFALYVPARFTDDPAEQAKFWALRSGIFPAVGGSRPAGTTCLIEDVAFHIGDLPRATAELQALIARHGYDDACIYGHALEGNYHFIINQSFSTPAEAARYEALMDDVAELVVGRYDGSLKAEHGTGRNMAPFLRREWGDAACAVMRAVKELFDPAGLLNPGVIFNDDPRCHLSHFKPLPLTDPLIDRCIECGFCEVNCLTCGLTLSSRQRIVVRREIARLKASGGNPRLVRELERGYRYPGERTLRRGRTLLDELSRGNQYGRVDPRPACVAGAARECGACRRGIRCPSFRRAEKRPASRADDGRCDAPGARNAGDDNRDEGPACAGASPMAAFDAAGLPDVGDAAHGARGGTGQGGLFPELHQPDDGPRP